MKPNVTQVAWSVPFDNERNCFVSDNVQEALEEVYSWKKIRSNLIGYETKIVDMVPSDCINWRALKYIIAIWNDTEQKTTMEEISITRSGSLINVSIHGILKRGIRIKIDPVLSGTQLNFTIENKESFPIEVELARLTLGI